MKTPLLTVLATTLPLLGFAQGKVQLANNGATAIVMGNASILRLQDASLANQGIPTTGPLPSGATLVCGLYAGTSSTSLSLYTTVVINPATGTGQAPGVITPTKATLPWGAVLTYMEVKAWDNAYATYEAARGAGGKYSGSSAMFTMTPGTSISYPNIYNGGDTTYSQMPWPDPVGIYPTPEPPPTALGGAVTFLLLVNRVVTRRRC